MTTAAVALGWEELLRLDPKDATAREQLRRLAVDRNELDSRRYVALSRLALAPPERDTVEAARSIAAEDPPSDRRWLVENAIATLGRLSSSEARDAFSLLLASNVEWKRAAARAVTR